MRTTLRATALATATLLSLSLVACSSGSPSGSSTESAAASAPAASESTPSQEESTKPSKPGAPEGFTVTEVSDVGLSIAVPSDWTILDKDSTNDPALLEGAAAAMGTTTDALTTMLAGASLCAVDPVPDDGVASHLMVTDTRLPTLPGETEVTAGQELIGVTPTTNSETETANGTAAAYYYILEGDAATMHGASVLVPSADGTYATIAVNTGSEAETMSIVQAILDSLA